MPRRPEWNYPNWDETEISVVIDRETTGLKRWIVTYTYLPNPGLVGEGRSFSVMLADDLAVAALNQQVGQV